MKASALSHRLGLNALAVCRHYLSNGHKAGRYWLVGNVQNETGKSLFVRLAAPGVVGKWTEYVARRIMLRIYDWALPHGRLTDSTQHNYSALREVM